MPSRPPSNLLSTNPEKNNFHVVRFVAASLVILGHSYDLLGASDAIANATGGLIPTALLGVDVFFTVSGYLVTQSLLRSGSYRSFVWKRFLRIYPGLAVCLLVTVFGIGALATSLSLREYFSNPATYRYFDNLTLFPPVTDLLPGVFEGNVRRGVNNSLWTLAYEVTCYGLLVLAHRLGILQRRYWKPELYVWNEELKKLEKQK